MSAPSDGPDRAASRRRARRAFEDVLGRIAPEIDLDQIEPAAELRREVDLDSVDFMNVLLGLEEELDLQIPETDTSRMTTLDGCLDYLADRLTRAS